LPVAVAGMVEPAPLQASWRSAPFRYTNEPTSLAQWEAIVLSPVADLAEFADPLDEYVRFGIDAPRTAGCVRATDSRWYNFDPQAYLECGMAGALGGGSEDDGLRKPVPGPVEPFANEPVQEAHAHRTGDDMTEDTPANPEPSIPRVGTFPEPVDDTVTTHHSLRTADGEFAYTARAGRIVLREEIHTDGTSSGTAGTESTTSPSGR
jgi:hypothetical protein